MILPAERLGHTLEFTPEALARSMQAGVEAAREALRAQDPGELMAALRTRHRRSA